MATKAASDAAFVAWNWAIESLATFKQINASDVTELVRRTPRGPDDLGISAKEIFSLRVLESLFVPESGGITKACSSAPDSKIGFDPSDRCADVLEHILLEIPGPNLKKELEKLKWDVQAFILHKRSCLPKCALEQLKDAILQGSHPCLASLKERAGLLIENVSESGIHVNDDDYSGFPYRIERSTDGQPVETRNSRSVNPEYRCNLFQEKFSERNMLLNKTVQSSLDENIEKITHKDFVTEVSSGKSKEEESRSFYVKEEGCGENEGSDQVSSSTLNDEEENDMESEWSADKVRYLKEMTDIDSKKHALLSYKCMLKEENDEQTHQKAPNICVHCSKGGDLLVCSSDSCPFVIHERCLKSAGTFDSRGKFYCYFCAYSQLVSDFQDAKKSYSLAKKNLVASICGGMKSWPTSSLKSNVSEKIAQRVDKRAHKRKRNDVNQVERTRYKSNRKVEQTGTSVFYAAAGGELSESKGREVTNGKGSLLKKRLI